MKKLKNKIPDGLAKCEVCGEYKGSVKEKDLTWDEYQEMAEKSDKVLTVSCLCQGIVCSKCKKNKIHRPVSNSYYEDDNRIEHWSSFTGMMGCGECREKKVNNHNI